MTGAPAHVLIIEDNEMSFVLADYLLRQAGYVTSRAADGSTGLRMAADNVADVILCDLDLPAMDGYQLISSLRAIPTWRAVPILAFTASVGGEEEASICAAGFAGCIAKPIDPQSFGATVARYLTADGSQANPRES